MDAIKKAMEEAIEQRARIEARQPEVEAKKAAEAIARVNMQDLMCEWQAF